MPPAINPTNCCDQPVECSCCPSGAPSIVQVTASLSSNPPISDPYPECTICADFNGTVDVPYNLNCEWFRLESSNCITPLAAQIRWIFRLTCNEATITAHLDVLSPNPPANDASQKTWQKVFTVEEFDCLDFEINYTAADIVFVNNDGLCAIGNNASVSSS